MRERERERVRGERERERVRRERERENICQLSVVWISGFGE